MIQISPAQVTPAIKSMFNLNMPTGIRAFAVMAGGNNGKIFTDDPAHPLWALVWEADDGVLYRGGKYGRDVLTEAVTLLKQEGIVALGFRDGDSDMDRFPPDPEAGAECFEFDRPVGISDLSPYLGALPDGYSIHRMDQALLERSPKYEETLNRYGSIENFLDKGIAISILHGDETVCEAYADMDIMGMRELGVRTQESYRRQGFATFACACLIKLCEESGSATYWDCAKFNLSSMALARKLGFQNERAYKLLAWFQLKE
ncbi:MAG: GNAT family N-acetyltransferase [Chloroflexi bacterium]|nr:GNAT family N-acetyltransferase [Chloroflexota bacterium]